VCHIRSHQGGLHVAHLAKVRKTDCVESYSSFSIKGSFDSVIEQSFISCFFKYFAGGHPADKFIICIDVFNDRVKLVGIERNLFGCMELDGTGG